ncbi:hypothetical protein CDD82_6344 [Ophiocordyceps australis]|uniref:Uncharacterized protein n=1 Tax=Ophiocordyceps australis TaxID=1399860 RepID=A0A2C5XGP1_9HYPO|nr:hypothetical protein CDD82_6344 [Ophiocordyceps australis]
MTLDNSPRPEVFVHHLLRPDSPTSPSYLPDEPFGDTHSRDSNNGHGESGADTDSLPSVPHSATLRPDTPQQIVSVSAAQVLHPRPHRAFERHPILEAETEGKSMIQATKQDVEAGQQSGNMQDAADSMTDAFEGDEDTNSSRSETLDTTLRAEEDEMWKRFVFNDDEDMSRITLQAKREALQQTTRQLMTELSKQIQSGVENSTHSSSSSKPQSQKRKCPQADEGKEQKQRQQKAKRRCSSRRDKARPDIRAIPDHDDDPIESS